MSFDLIIIGAGINGAGIARDAAMRGLKVLLLDKGDIGGGTSSASTRLIHGGLRYLEHGEFGLVRESLRERETLLRIAPHLVRPLPILIPIYGNARRVRWTIRAGMIAYDLLSIGKSLPRHRMLSRAEALQRAPALNQEELIGAALYYDAQIEFAERLVLENALAAHEHGAEIKTYARVDKIIVKNATVRGVEFTDVLHNERHSASAQIVVNASGPWVDELVRGLGSRRMIGGTKGSHIVVAPFAGAPETAIYVEAATDHRPFFIIPWNGNYLIGTTDIRYEGDLDRVVIDDDEIDYLLAETNRALPEAHLTRESILFSYSGVRPLPYTTSGAEQSITRKHLILDHAPRLNGLISIIGGKLTTYRHLAEQVADFVFKRLERSPQPCRTGTVPLPGAATPVFNSFAEQFKVESGLASELSERLLRIYGTRASDVLKVTAENPALAGTLTAETKAIAAEVVFAFQTELAQTMADCLLRRTMIGLDSLSAIDQVSVATKIAQDHLGWSNDRALAELTQYENEIERFSRIASQT